MNIQELKKTANQVRKNIITEVFYAKAGHPGGSLSSAEIYTYLYMEEMNVDPENPTNPDRDRFVLSKGHTCPGLYGVMAERGYFDREELKTFRHLGSRLQGHPSMRYLPGIDMSSGSLGQGISCAVGMALAADGIDAEVINICTIKPLDEELIVKTAAKTGKVVTVEEHNIIGGLGSAVAECLVEKCPTKMYRIGMRDKFGESGSAGELIHKYMLDGEGIYKQVKAFVEGN